MALVICATGQGWAIKIHGRVTDAKSGLCVGGCLILIPVGYRDDQDTIVASSNGTFYLELDSIKA
jgi:hypothetical protein